MTRAQSLALLVALLLAGFALRLYQLDSFSFRGDEAITVLNWVGRPLLETLQSEIPVRDPQPPLAFALFRGWALLFGTGELAMRLLPALGSLAGIAGMYALGHRLDGRHTGLFAAALVTVHPFLIWHAQDARPYAIWVSAGTIAVWLALCALRRNRTRDWLLYVLAASAAAYLYYLEIFYLAALNLFVLSSLRSQGRLLRRWLIAQLLLAVVLAPWYLQDRILFSSDYGGTAAALEPLQLLTWLMPALQFGRSLPPEISMRSALLVICVLLAGLWFMARRNNRYTLLVGLLAFLPPLLLGLAATFLNVFTPRYVLASVPACLLLLTSLGKELWRRSRWTRVLAAGIFAAWLGLMLLSLNNAWFNPEFARSPDWRGLANYLHRETAAGDMVIQTAADEAFTLYFADRREFLRLPANPVQDESEILEALRSAQATYDSLWLVASPPPDWPNRHVGIDWLEANLQLVRKTQIGALPVRQYRSWKVHTRELAEETLATFSQTAELAGAATGRTPSDLTVEVVWRATGRSGASLKGFAHLYDTRGPAGGSPLWSQDDQYIQDGRADTRTWETGTLLRDVYQLPLHQVPQGEYELYIGLYDPESGERVSTNSGQDSVRVARVTVRGRESEGS
ncbi:MAG: glycosyltransferase family 39 protein [Anaerolineaceae bacterium]|nr:glycosyltransferase family 39 protein [Anaerolineaceae bacterium]